METAVIRVRRGLTEVFRGEGHTLSRRRGKEGGYTYPFSKDEAYTIYTTLLILNCSEARIHDSSALRLDAPTRGDSRATCL